MANEPQNRVAHTQWLKRGTNTFLPTDNSTTQATIDKGVYNIRHNPEVGYYLVKRELNLDELIDIPSVEAAEIVEGVETFWKRADKFKEYGYSYKRGILLYGAPGTGKTSIINLLCKKLIEEKDGIVFIISTEADLNIYTNFMSEIYRVIEPDRPLIAIIEDIDGLCQSKEVETKLINVLDGIEQLENIVYLATTNYMERLSERLTNRPNRFDRRIEIKSPSREAREMYFKHKLKPDDIKNIDLEQWLNDTEHFTMAQLGEVIKSVIILGNTFEHTLKILDKLKTTVNSRDYNKDFDSKIGFNKR